jgi:hypothetical protein
MFSKEGCIGSAFFMYFIGCTSIYLMAVLSLERYYIICKPLNIRKLSAKTNLVSITACTLNGLLWAVLPLLGWSHYALEGANTSCSVEWRERSVNVMSYNIVIFCLVYLLPLGVILFTNARLVSLVNFHHKIHEQIILRINLILI